MSSSTPKAALGWCSCIFNTIFNVKHSIRRQMWTILGMSSTIAIVLVLIIGVVLITNLRSTANDTASTGLEMRTRENLLIMAQEVADVIDLRLQTVVRSGVMHVAHQSSLFLSTAWNDQSQSNVGVGSNGSLPYNPEVGTSFVEYNFVPQCGPASTGRNATCPSDYGALMGRSLIPDGFDGSMLSSSVYLFHGPTQCAIQTNEDLAAMVTPASSYVMDRLAFLDLDLRVLSNRLPTTVQYYVSARVSTLSSSPSSSSSSSSSTASSYQNVHRSYPGMAKPTPACGASTYDATKRAWFTKATSAGVGGLAIASDRNVFTGALTMTLSTVVAGPLAALGHPVTLVTAAAMDMTELHQFVANKTFLNHGYAALVRTDTTEVLFYGAGSPPFVDALARFFYLNEIDPGLTLTSAARIDGGTGVVTEFTSRNGTEYFVAQVPLLNGKLALMFYGVKSEAYATLPGLDSATTATTATVLGLLCGLCVATAVVVGVVVYLVTDVFRDPLEALSRGATNLLMMCVDDVATRNYRSSAIQVGVSSSSVPEISDLIHSYERAVDVLAAVDDRQRAQPKYTPNPLCGREGLELLGFDAGDDSLVYHGTNASIHACMAALHQTDKQYDHTRSGPIMGGDGKSQGFSLSPPSYDAAAALGIGNTNMNMNINNNNNNNNNNDMGETKIQSATVAMKATQQQDVHVVLQQVQVQEKNCLRRKMSLQSRIRIPVFITLFVGLIATVVISLAILSSQGHGWMSDTTRAIYSSQLELTGQVTNTKTEYVRSFFNSMSVDLALAASTATQILNGSLPWQDWSPSLHYYRSYSLDPYNTHTSSRPLSFNYSGYFTANDRSCASGSGRGCDSTLNSNVTRLTSIMDLKMSALFYSNSLVSFIQLGLDGTTATIASDSSSSSSWVGTDCIVAQGFTRILPYQPKSNYAAPTTCLVDVVPARPECPCTVSAGGIYPAYDPRCRSWYRAAYGKDPTKTYFLELRISSGGSPVLTGSTPLVVNQTANVGVLSSNVLVSDFSAKLNLRRFLDVGYVFMISLAEVEDSVVLVHPRLTATCTLLSCVEPMIGSDSFATDLMTPLRAGVASSVQFVKTDKSLWHLTYRPVDVGTNVYGLVVAVPDDAILAITNSVEHTISTTVRDQIIIFAVVFVVLGVALWLSVSVLSKRIAVPIQELRTMLAAIERGDLTRVASSHATSSEMSRVLEAFSGMIVALRAGSESYAAGDIGRAVTAFHEAVELYRRLDNQRGLAIAQNNLAQALFRKGDLAGSHMYNSHAIEIGRRRLLESEARHQEIVKKNNSIRQQQQQQQQQLNHHSQNVTIHVGTLSSIPPSAIATTPAAATTTTTTAQIMPIDRGEEIKSRAQKQKRTQVLSDRLGNMAAVLLERGMLTEAITVLDEATRLDDECNNLRGLVVKRGLRGQCSQKQGKPEEALQMYITGLQFIADNAARFEPDDSALGQQFFLLYIGQYFVATKADAEARWALLHSATRHHFCDMSATSRALIGLRSIYEASIFSSPSLVSHSSIMMPSAPVGELKEVPNLILPPGGLSDTLPASATRNRTNATFIVQRINAAMAKFKLNDGSTGPLAEKDLLFCLDYSGSMAGHRIQRSIENMLRILDNHCKPLDNVALIRFNEKVNKVMDLTPRQSVDRELFQRSVNPDGGTAFFDALLQGINMMNTSLRSRRFLIALTDGEDNSSHAYGTVTITNPNMDAADHRMRLYVNNLKPVISDSNITLIVIGVDLLGNISNYLRELCAASPTAVFIDVSNDSKEKLDGAFVRVSNIIQGHNLSLEAF